MKDIYDIFYFPTMKDFFWSFLATGGFEQHRSNAVCYAWRGPWQLTLQTSQNEIPEKMKVDLEACYHLKSDLWFMGCDQSDFCLRWTYTFTCRRIKCIALTKCLNNHLTLWSLFNLNVVCCCICSHSMIVQSHRWSLCRSLSILSLVIRDVNRSSSVCFNVSKVGFFFGSVKTKINQASSDSCIESIKISAHTLPEVWALEL